LGVQQYARRFERLRAENHGFSSDFFDLSRQAIDVGHTARFVGGGVHIDVAYDGVCDQRAVAGSDGILDGRKRAAEIRKRAAAALARSAIVTLKTTIVILREDRRAADGYSVAELRLYSVS
jgi:hypothetical protein